MTHDAEDRDDGWGPRKEIPEEVYALHAENLRRLMQIKFANAKITIVDLRNEADRG